MTWNIDLIRKAWNTAARAHDGQQYGGPGEGEYIEYLNHIGGVMLEVMSALPHHPEADAQLAIACAILHDTVEDSDIRVKDIEDHFGTAIARGVAALTKDKSVAGKREQMIDSLERIRQESHEVWMVKMADRIFNLSAPPFYWDTPKMVSYREEAILIYNYLHPASEHLAQRLWQRIERYTNYFAHG